MPAKLTSKEIEDSKSYPSRVFYCSPYNSTFFTTCCQVAITDREQQCPRCERYVVGWDNENRNSTRSSVAKSGGYR